MAIIGVLKRNTCHIEECNANPYKSTRWQDQQLENIAKDKGKTEAIGLGNRQPKNTNPNGVARSDFGRRGIRRFASGCTLSIVTNMDLAFGNIIGSVFRRLSVLVRPDSGRPVGTSIHDGWPRSQAVGLSFTHILVRLNRHPLCKAGVNRGRSKSFAIQALHRICDP